MPTYLDRDQTCIKRTARKVYRCAGNGASGDARRWSLTCDVNGRSINIGVPHVEYVGEVPLYQSGTRHCMECHREFWPAES